MIIRNGQALGSVVHRDVPKASKPKPEPKPEPESKALPKAATPKAPPSKEPADAKESGIGTSSPGAMG